MAKWIQKTIEQFSGRSAIIQLRQGIRVRWATGKESSAEEMIANLANAITKLAIRRGYGKPDIKDYVSSPFDFGQAVGVALTAKVRKDPNGSMIFAIANQYEKINAELSERCEQLEKIITGSQKITTARAKLRKSKIRINGSSL